MKITLTVAHPLIAFAAGILAFMPFVTDASAQEAFPDGVRGVVVAPPVSAEGVVLYPFVEPFVLGLQDTTPVIQLDDALADHAAAEQAAQDYNAAVVVWGEADDESMRWRFYTPLAERDYVHVTWYGSSLIYPRHIELELPYDVNGLGLVSFVRGLNFYHEELYLRSFVEFNQAIRQLNVKSSPLNLGGLYFYSAATHLQRAITQNEPDLLQTAFEQSHLALDYYSADTFLYERAATRNNLAQVHQLGAWYWQEITEAELALPLYSDALDYWTPDTFPLEYAAASNNLGAANMIYSYFVAEPFDFYSTAIALFEQALVYHTPDAAPHDHAMAQANLGLAYYRSAGYDQFRTQVLLEQSIIAYQAALDYWTFDNNPALFASTNHDLAVAYGFLSEFSDRQANLLRSISAHDAALTYYTPNNAPYEYAGVQITRGLTYYYLASSGSNRRFYLNESINAYREVLRHFRPFDFPEQYSVAQASLGDSYYSLAQIGDNTLINLRASVSAYESSLRYLTEADDPIRYANTVANLAGAHLFLATEGEYAEENFLKAIALFDTALAVNVELGLLPARIYYSRGIANFNLINLATTPEDARVYRENFLRDMAEAEARGEFIPAPVRRDIAAVEASLSQTP